jgi:hypothetical protein
MDWGAHSWNRQKFDDSRQQFEKYIELRPEDASGHFALGMTYASDRNCLSWMSRRLARTQGREEKDNR